MLSSETTAASMPLNWSLTCKRNGHDEGGAVVRAQRQRLAAKDHRLRAGRESALQRLADEGVLVGAEIAGAGALAVSADGRQVENVGIAGDEIFEQARHLRARGRDRPPCRAGR